MPQLGYYGRPVPRGRVSGAAPPPSVYLPPLTRRATPTESEAVTAEREKLQSDIRAAEESLAALVSGEDTPVYEEPSAPVISPYIQPRAEAKPIGVETPGGGEVGKGPPYKGPVTTPGEIYTMGKGFYQGAQVAGPLAPVGAVIGSILGIRKVKAEKEAQAAYYAETTPDIPGVGGYYSMGGPDSRAGETTVSGPSVSEPGPITGIGSHGLAAEEGLVTEGGTTGLAGPGAATGVDLSEAEAAEMGLGMDGGGDYGDSDSSGWGWW